MTGLKRQEQLDIMDDFLNALSAKFPLDVRLVVSDGIHKITEDDILQAMRDVHKARIAWDTIDPVTPHYAIERKDAYDNYMVRDKKLKTLQNLYRMQQTNE